MRATRAWGSARVLGFGGVMLSFCVGSMLAQSGGERSAGQGRMTRPRLLIHVVADLDRTLAFYRDGIGFTVASPPAPLTGSTLLDKVKHGHPAASARAATMTIPGSNLQLQVIQFSGAGATPFTQRLYDPGVTRFSIQVRDIDLAFANVKDRGIVVDTTSAGPVFTQRPRNDTRAVMMRDPDGFVFEFVQPGAPPETDVPATSNVFNARSSLAVDDMDRALVFYRDLLGFTVTNPPNYVNDAVLVLEGTLRAKARTAQTMPPGSNNMWVIWEFSEIERTRRAPAPQDPGASAISLEVENLPALLARLARAGITVETPGAAPIDLGGGHRGALVRSPDGLLVELLE
jgi:catechol 2,3-dioxygenase-like lactoylglutathione lyase family enzyme